MIIMQMTEERIWYLVKLWSLPFSTPGIWSVNIRSCVASSHTFSPSPIQYDKVMTTLQSTSIITICETWPLREAVT